jgi:hypothetical protein
MTQSAAMTALWHPAMRADWLVLRRTGAVAFVRVIGVPALLLACCAVVMCGDFYGGYGWCLAAGTLLALGGSYAIAHERLLGALERWRFGWCAALPVARGATASTLLLVTVTALVASVTFITALLLGISVPAPHRADLAYAWMGIVLALVAGTAVAAVRVYRRGALALQADGVREPLLALPWLDDRRLPHLLDWQRRAALVRWQRGGNFVMVGVVLAGVPNAPSLPMVVALVLLVLSWTWLAVVMRAGAEATGAAMRLLAAVPLDVHRARRASLRYPLIAALCALVSMAIGAVLSGRGVIALAWIVGAGLVSAWPLIRMLRATRRPEWPA